MENVRLLCPFCVKEGRTEPVEVSPDFVRLPALLERWVPKWARGKGFISLREAVAKDARLGALIVKANGRDEAAVLCVQHGFALREAKIWTEKLSVVLERRAAAADRKATEAFGSIASILGGQQALVAGQPQGVEPEGDGAQDRSEQERIMQEITPPRTRKAKKPAKPKKAKGEGKPQGSTKGREQGKIRGEIDAALEGDAS